MDKTTQIRKELALFCALHGVAMEGNVFDKDGNVILGECRIDADSVDQEARDLAEMHRKIAEVMKTAFFGMRHSLRLTDEELKHTGSKTKEAAALGSYDYAQKQIDKLTKEHLRKYPD